MQEMWVRFLGREDPLQKKMATHSSILAWEIPWTEESVGLWPMGSQESWTGLSDETRNLKCREKKVIARSQTLVIIVSTVIVCYFLFVTAPMLSWQGSHWSLPQGCLAPGPRQRILLSPSGAHLLVRGVPVSGEFSSRHYCSTPAGSRAWETDSVSESVLGTLPLSCLSFLRVSAPGLLD